MDDDCDVGSAEGPVLNNQVLSNLTFTLQDPLSVCCRRKPKSLRQKNPKENKEIKKRACSICKKTGHVRTSCPSQKQVRYSYKFCNLQ
jgi:hypothetical protein